MAKGLSSFVVGGLSYSVGGCPLLFSDWRSLLEIDDLC